MDIINLIFGILSIIVSITGIFVSRYYWKHSYKEIKLIKDLQKLSEEKIVEGYFKYQTELIRKLLEENPDVKNPYNIHSKNFIECMNAAMFNLQADNFTSLK